MANFTGNISFESSLQIRNRYYAERFLPSSIILISFIVSGVLGNFVVISVYILRSNLRTYGRHFIPYLAILDIMSLLFGASISLMKNYKHVTFPGDILCKILTYFVFTSVSSSLTLLLVIALQRYYLICRPLLSHFTLKMRRILLLLSVCVPGVFIIPFVMWNGTFPVKYNGLQCGFLPQHLDRSLTYRIISGMIPLLEVVIVTCIYIKIWTYIPNAKFKNGTKTLDLENKLDNNVEIEIKEMCLRKFDAGNSVTNVQYISEDTEENITPSENSGIEVQPSSGLDLPVSINTRKFCLRYFHCGMGSRRRSMGRTTTVLFIISAVGFLSYLPSSVIVSLEIKDHLFFDKLTQEMFLLCSILRVFYLFNHSVNPFIYGIYDAKFRNELIAVYRSAINKVNSLLQN